LSASTNETVISYSVEQSPGVLAGSPTFKSLEVNDISTLGATITTTPRNPIANTRGPRKGSPTDLDSSVELPADLTIDSFLDFSQGFMYSSWYSQAKFDPTAVTSTGYTVGSGGNLDAGTLIYARNFQNLENNGLKVVGSASTSTEIKTTGLVAESSPPAGAMVEVAGFQGASGDLQINASGDLTSTALDFTTLGIIVGQKIYIGGNETATQFAGTNNKGLARVRVVEANKLTLDHRDQDYTTDTGAGKTIQIFIGSFIRDQPVQDPKFLRETYTFEAAYAGLGAASNENWYEYAKGNYANTFTFSNPGQALCTLTMGFVGLDTAVPTQTQVSATRKVPTRTSAFNTSSDYTRIRVNKADETGLTSYFDSLEIAINNNVNARKVLGTLGAAFVNIGSLEVTGTADVIFTDTGVIEAVRNNCTVSLNYGVRNQDGALDFSIPSMTLGGADKSFPRNESITLSITGNAFTDTFFGYVFGITYFPYMPGSTAAVC